MPICTVTANLADLTDSPVTDVPVVFTRKIVNSQQAVGIDGKSRLLVPISITADASGQFSVGLFPGEYEVRVSVSDGSVLTFDVGVPEETTANLSDIIAQGAAVTPSVLADAVAARDVALAAAYLIAEEKTADHTLTAGDLGKSLEFNSASLIRCTIPADATEALPDGFVCAIVQSGAGALVIEVEGGVALVKPGGAGLQISEQWAGATLIKRAADSWRAEGNFA